MSPYLKPENNDTTSHLADGLVEADQAYSVPSAEYILFVVQPNERNMFDQRCLEYELLEKHGIRVVRQILIELATTASLSGSSQSHWKARSTLERSHAINSLNIPLQLAGGKKIQEILSQPGVVEQFLPISESNAAAQLRETWVPMSALDAETPLTLPASFPVVAHNPGEPLGATLARRHAECLVPKPKREGGGHNVCKGDIPAVLDGFAAEEGRAWIAMALIVPPAGVVSYPVRAGSGARQNRDDNDNEGSEERAKLVGAETISELGIFGLALFGEDEGAGVVRKERGDVGWLMRTKGVESSKGGVAAGFSVLDSVVLVDG